MDEACDEAAWPETAAPSQVATVSTPPAPSDLDLHGRPGPGTRPPAASRAGAARTPPAPSTLDLRARPSQAGAARPHAFTSLLDLPDDLLLLILSLLPPLPDTFSTGRTCARLHALASSDALKLRVAPSPRFLTARTPRAVARATFTDLAAAVAASRPGDTILLEPGSRAACADLAIDHPLCLTASSSSDARPAPLLSAPPGAGAALVLHASARLAGLQLTSPPSGGACLDHRAGVLVVYRCSLAMARPGGPAARSPCGAGLPLLHSPIVSRTCGVGKNAIRVSETRMTGGEAGQAAVRAPGGVVRDVRVIGNVFWLSVTARAWGGVGVAGMESGGDAAALGAPCPAAATLAMHAHRPATCMRL